MPPRRRAKVSRANTQFKKPRKAANRSSRLLAEWQEVEGDWCDNKCNILSEALTQNASTSALGDEHIDFVDFERESNPIDGLLEPVTEESEVETEYEDESEASLECFDEPVAQSRGDVNRKRRIREERQWSEVIEPMFKAFMKCKLLTRQWSDPETWKIDSKPDCRCSIAKRRVCELELYDILGQSHLLL